MGRGWGGGEEMGGMGGEGRRGRGGKEGVEGWGNEVMEVVRGGQAACRGRNLTEIWTQSDNLVFPAAKGDPTNINRFSVFSHLQSTPPPAPPPSSSSSHMTCHPALASPPSLRAPPGLANRHLVFISNHCSALPQAPLKQHFDGISCSAVCVVLEFALPAAARRGDPPPAAQMATAARGGAAVGYRAR